MLNFLKKGRSFSNDDKIAPENIARKNSLVLSSSWQSTLKTDSIYLDEQLDNETNEILEPRSRLSMNLNNILSDRTCLSYFIQFLETKNALSLIKFYLDSESFKQVSEKEIASLKNHNNNYYGNYINSFRRYKTRSLSSDNFDRVSLNSNNSYDVSDSISIGSQLTNVTYNCDHLMTNSSMSLDEKQEDELSKNERINQVNILEENQNDQSTLERLSKSCNLKTVPELKTLCDLSLRKPLTDDEKSLLVLNENNQKHFHKKLSKSISANNFNGKIQSPINELNSSDSFRLKTNNNIHKEVNQPKQKNIWASIATDAVRIYRKYLTSNSPYYIDIPATIQSTISLQMCSINNTQEKFPNDSSKLENNINIDGIKSSNPLNYSDDDFEDSVSSKCFTEAQKYVFERLEADYLKEFLESSFYCKYIIDILTNQRSLTISDILNSETALFYFMEFLEEKREHRDLLEFWIAAMNFRKHYLNIFVENCVDDFPSTPDNFDDEIDGAEDQLRNDAMIIYNKYFSLQSENPLPVSSRIRSQIEEYICSVDEENICKCFDLALKIVEKFFEKAYFHEFMTSSLFSNYLNDLKSKIPDYELSEERFPANNRTKIALKSFTTRHRKTLSDCSAETLKDFRTRSLVSQYNSPIASTNENSKFKTSKSADMKIDARHLNDPDLLWKRNYRTGLIFGRVNSLGRYERDFDATCHNEDKWSLANGSHKIKNAMRKFVNLPEDKVQEEIAWQIAEMIVKDVTDVTLGVTESDSIGDK